MFWSVSQAKNGLNYVVSLCILTLKKYFINIIQMQKKDKFVYCAGFQVNVLFNFEKPKKVKVEEKESDRYTWLHKCYNIPENVLQ